MEIKNYLFEEWRPVAGYEDIYEVSNYGRVRSLDRVIMRCDGKKMPLKGTFLKPIPERNGYLRVDLSRAENGKITSKRHYIHRLVAIAFIPNPLGLPEINHKDEDKTNNHVENLEWCDRSFNCSYGAWVEKHIGQRRKKVVSILDDTVVKEYASINDAARDVDANCGSIMRVLRGERKHCRGYEWRYA